MKRALITGCEGFAGTHLWGELEKNGYEVFGTTLKEPGRGQEKTVYHADVTVKEDLKEIINNLLPDYIFNLAAQAAPSVSFKYPRLTIAVNTIGVANLLEVIREIPKYRPRLLLIGTSEEYGIIDAKDLPVTEDHPLNPISPYSVSKLATYHLCKIYSRAYDMDIVYASTFNNTGPGQLPGFLAPDVAEQIVKIERGKQKPLVLTGSLETYRDYTDVRDVVKAYRLLAEKGKNGERYNICSGECVSTKSVVETLIGFSTLNINHQVDPLRNRPSDLPVIKGSFEKIHKATGWKPEIPIEVSLKDLLESFRDKE